MKQVTNYQEIKKSYRHPEVANVYDSRRFFKSARKERLNKHFLTAIGGVLSGIEDRGHKIDRLLDVPCGTGRIFPELLALKVNFIASDISFEMMKASADKGNLNEFKMVQIDAEQMPYKDDSFDVVTSLRFFTMRVPKEARASIFKEMNRVSRGWIVAEFRHKNPLSTFSNWIITRIFKHPPRFNYYLIDELKRELNQAGIELVKVFWPFGLFSNKIILLGKTKQLATAPK